nr:replication protein A 70 kDa DNA-binding subunit B-like [Ipomoea batatas]
MYQVVDAFDNDGWWVGQITGEYRNSYYVYFEHYDLIGRVVSIHQPKDILVKQNSQRLIDFVIEDCRGSRLTVTLWDEHVDSVLPFFNGALTDPLIVILQLCRARVTDDGEIRISSSYSATRVLFNYECPEVFAFKDRFLTPIWTISSRSRNTGSGSLETMSNESITMTSLMNIYDDKKVGEFWVLGEITDIQRDWYFIACANKGCGKKIQEINDQMYYIVTLLSLVSPQATLANSTQPRYSNVAAMVHAIFVFNENVYVVGPFGRGHMQKPIGDMKFYLHKEDCMPNEIEGLIGKTMKFMIVTREDQFKYKGNAAFTVLGVQADEAKSNSFKKGEQGNVIRKLAEEKEFNENFGQSEPTITISNHQIVIFDPPFSYLLLRFASSGIEAMTKGFVISNGLCAGVIRNGLWVAVIRNGLWAST